MRLILWDGFWFLHALFMEDDEMRQDDNEKRKYENQQK